MLHCRAAAQCEKKYTRSSMRLHMSWFAVAGLKDHTGSSLPYPEFSFCKRSAMRLHIAEDRNSEHFVWGIDAEGASILSVALLLGGLISNPPRQYLEGIDKRGCMRCGCGCFVDEPRDRRMRLKPLYFMY